MQPVKHCYIGIKYQNEMLTITRYKIICIAHVLLDSKLTCFGGASHYIIILCEEGPA